MSDLDTRREIRSLIGRLEIHHPQRVFLLFACICIAFLFGVYPDYEGLSQAGHWHCL